MDVKLLDSAINQYIETALWSESDDNGNSLLESYDASDIVLTSLHAMARDVRMFVFLLDSERPGALAELDAGQFGHDFWLTRNHHGAGFWDRGLGELGDWLTKWAHVEGDAGLYVGDDGRLHYSEE